MEVSRLDEVVLRLRHLEARPAWRRRVLAGLPDLTVRRLRVLRAIERGHLDDGPATVGDIAALLEVGPSTASRAVDDVVALGWAEKTPLPVDNRRVGVALARPGAAALAHATANRRAILSQATASWSAADRSGLEALLARFVEDVEAAIGP